MCCLKNEEDTYEYLNSRLPGAGDRVTTGDDLKGEVQSVNVLRQRVKVVVDDGEEKELREYEADRCGLSSQTARRPQDQQRGIKGAATWRIKAGSPNWTTQNRRRPDGMLCRRKR